MRCSRLKVENFVSLCRESAFNGSRPGAFPVPLLVESRNLDKLPTSIGDAKRVRHQCPLGMASHSAQWSNFFAPASSVSQ